MDKSPIKRGARGALLKGIWYCECDPKLPAEHFQTKNGGPNHGRWFYTCQKSQPKRCKFFLWDSDAKIREEAAVLDNSGSDNRPTTPTKAVGSGRGHTLPNPSPSQQKHPGIVTPAVTGKKSPSETSSSDYDWSATSSNDRALTEEARKSVMPPPKTPRKTPRTSHFDSPGKRKHAETLEGISNASTSEYDGDVFNTPPSSRDVSGLLSPIQTPVRERGQHIVPPQTNSNLATEALRILQNNRLPAEVEQELVDLLNRHDLRTQGIAKGRDITRLALATKEKKIAELEAQVVGLEAERETGRAVITHLKRDMAQTSPSKSRRQ